MKYIFRLLTIYFCINLTPINADNSVKFNSIVGEVMMTEGESYIIRDIRLTQKEDWIVVKIGTPIYKNDIIKTTNRGSIRIFLLNKVAINMGKNSEVMIEKYISENQEDSTICGCIKYTFKYIITFFQKIVPSKFELKIETATVGIRG